jgi:glycosyltransferase involved in cell wall biosynthesis
VIQTLHDLDPHVGVRFAGLIRLWNRLMVRSVDRVLVHGQVYRQHLLAQGMAPERVRATPLLHGFLSYAAGGAIDALGPGDVACEPWALFFGRLEPYKGVGTLLEAAGLAQAAGGVRLVVAGPGELAGLWDRPLPAGVELRPRRIDDAEASDLFRRCGLLVLHTAGDPGYTLLKSMGQKDDLISGNYLGHMFIPKSSITCSHKSYRR